MKFTVEITKARFYSLIVLVVVLGVALIVSGTGFTAGQPSHPTLFADIIRGKTGAAIHVVDSLGLGTATPTQKLDVVGNVNAQGYCVNGVCRNAVPLTGSRCVIRTNTATSGSSCGASVLCQSGETVVGGGCEHTGCDITISKPGGGWVCGGFGSPGPFTSTVFAICCS